jgi:xanthine dehydrogenase accessory factor
MAVESARHVVEHGGRRYYFCSSGCKRAFEEEPEKYATQASPR